MSTHSGRAFMVIVVYGQAQRDLRWVGIWAATTLMFVLIGVVGHNAWWSGALITGTFLLFYGAASFDAWRDRVARLERDDEPAN
jgi:hypothetical protein